jgi:methionine-rich copper-binding protein CopC
MKTVTFRSLTIAAVIGLVLVPAEVSAHADFVSGSPANGATLGTGPIDVVATFSEELAAKSHMELLDASGTVVARAAIDGTQMRIGLDGLPPATYEIKWTSVADDGDILRNTDQPWKFTVAAGSSSQASAQASAAPSSAEASAVPTQALSPAPAPSSAPSHPATTSSTDVLFPILAAVILIALLGAWLLRRRSRVGR